MDRFEAGEALRLMEVERCTHFSGNDTMALMLLNHPDRSRRNLALRGAWAAASPAIMRRIIDELGARECVVGYGLSEASPNIAQSCWWEPEEVRVAARMRPQPGVAVRIVGEDGADCPPGTPGQILVRGWNVMRGYFDKPKETAEALDRPMAGCPPATSVRLGRTAGCISRPGQGHRPRRRRERRPRRDRGPAAPASRGATSGGRGRARRAAGGSRRRVRYAE